MYTLASKETEALLPTEILYQTQYWAKVKSHVGLKPLAFDILSAERLGDVLLLVQSFGRGQRYAVVPQGPEYAPPQEDYGRFIEDLSVKIFTHLGKNLAFIRYDLPWKSPYADEVDIHERGGFPESRVRETRMNMNTRFWNIRKSASDMTVASSLVVDISGSEEDILYRMKEKTRYNIGLARRKGVTVHSATADNLRDFYVLYRQTAIRNGFSPCRFIHFASLFKCRIDAQKDAELVFLFAKHNDDILAGAIVAVSGKAANFLYGASANRKRNLMAPYAMHWAAMLACRELGCTSYEMGAVSPGATPDHPFYGMYRFKTGFGGRIEYSCGSWDYPFDHDSYMMFSNAEKLKGGEMPSHL